ncbi:MAG: non-canonical purine NTP pyrophosphatase [Vicinamibacterales bacterium]
MTTLVVATTNEGKLREIRELLAGLPVEVKTLSDFPPVPAPEETGTTFAENARQKALYYATATGMMAVAEDSGLEVDAMGGAPGVQSARFGGEHSRYPEKFALIYAALAEAGAHTSTARFVCALAVARGAEVNLEARGYRWKGRLLRHHPATAVSATTRFSSTLRLGARWPRLALGRALSATEAKRFDRCGAGSRRRRPHDRRRLTSSCSPSHPSSRGGARSTSTSACSR